MVRKPLLFCEDLGRQIHDSFLLAISRGEFCEPRTGFVESSSRRTTCQYILSEIASRTVKRRPNMMKNVTSQVQLGKAVLSVE